MIDRSRDSLVVTWKWSRREGRSFLMVGLLFVFLACAAFFTKDRYGEPPPLEVEVFLVLLGSALFVPLSALGIAHLLNSTEVVATKSNFTCRNIPVWPNVRSFQAEGVRQFFVSFSEPTKNYSTFARISFLDNNDHAHLLVSKLPSRLAAY